MISNSSVANNLRISVSELQSNLSQYTLLDVRTEADYKKGHIEQALSFFAGLTYQDVKENGALTKPKDMQPLLQRLGLTDRSKVVIYDNGQLVHAARVFWAFEVYGIKNVKVLDGGYPAWVSKGLKITKTAPLFIQPSNYVPQINSKRLASKFQTQLATLNPNKLIIDARPTRAYMGEISSAKRYGRIPTAINVPAEHNFESSGNFSHLQSIDSLKDLYRGVPKNKKIITYCALGRVSAANYLALRELGYDVANYDASWKEWGNDFQLPIEKGTK